MKAKVIKLTDKESLSIIRETIEEIVSPYEIKNFSKDINVTEWQYIEQHKQDIWNFLNDGYKFAGYDKFCGCDSVRSLFKNANLIRIAFCNEVAENLVSALSNFEVARNHTRNNFEDVKAEIQKRLNERVDAVGSKGMYVDIMQIQMNDMIGKRSLWDWAKNLSRIENPQKQEEALSVFKSEFYRTYFRKIFAGDFSKRDKVSIRYNERVKAKLSGPNQEIDDVDYNNDSICIATLGKSIDDINWYVNQVHHTDSVICVVYLDAPISVALSQNQKRDRRVSEDFIRNTFTNINNTWNFLKLNLTSTRIWRLFRLEPSVASNNMIRNYKVVENIPNPSMLNIESQRE